MRNNLLALSWTLVVFAIIIFFINCQLYRLQLKQDEKIASAVVNRIEKIIDEAKNSSEKIAEEKIIDCTKKAQFLLAQEAALNTHVRTIIIEKNNEVWCSSLAGKRLVSDDKILPPQKELTLMELRANDKYKSLFIVLVYRKKLSHSAIYSTISERDLREILNVPGEDVHLSLMINTMVLQPDGKLLIVNTLPPKIVMKTSKEYPFTVIYKQSDFLSFNRTINKGGILILSITIMCLFLFVALKNFLIKSQSLTESLKLAISQGEIIPFYQPIINYDTGELYGVEVLARWHHQTHGFISPEIFIELAEKNDLITELTRGLMNKVSYEINRLGIEEVHNLNISINISAKHFKSTAFINDCINFKNSIINPTIKFVLELTEREPLDIDDKVKETLKVLKEHKFLLALDDFGTGYSGLSYLQNPWVDYIKIDKVFIHQVSYNPESTVLLESVIDLASSLSLTVIAEGVETKEQINFLKSKGITLLQGYYFSKPLSITELVCFITSNNYIHMRQMKSRLS